MVAQKRFELLSKAPEASMLDHYTTGLQTQHKQRRSFITLTLRFAAAILSFLGFTYTVAFLADSVVAFAAPKRIHDWV